MVTLISIKVSELLSDEEMAKEACLAVAMGRNNQQRFSVDSIQNGTPRTPLSGAKNTLSCYVRHRSP